MNFLKPVMRLKELKKMGYPESLLLEAYRDRNQNFAMKLNSLKTNSPIIFETEGLNKWLQEKIRIERLSQPTIRRNKYGVKRGLCKHATSC